ncbi:MATE family efflux transporter [Brassicibacter mesophilus]|uniref:MATE family efflux transporter n=1 Tax=Brassicibacter mesophilus TaxID=745119 RepID=UPI003D1F95A8
MQKTTVTLSYDSGFYKTLFKIALPIVMQNFIAASLNMVDTVMIGEVGEAEIAAVGIANQFFFLFTLIIMGIYSGCGIFISQFWGNRDEKNIKRILGLSLITGVGIAIIFTITALFMPEKIMQIFNKDPHVISLGAKYLRVVCLSYILTSVTFAYSMASRCIERTILPMIVSSLALLANTVFNYMFIFGNFGAPALGVEGAALATLISRIIETSILVGYIYISKDILSAKGRELLDIDKIFMSKAFHTIIPVVLNEMCWGLGAVVYSIAYGRIGTQAMAAVQICNTVQNLYMVLVFGMASAAAVMIGNQVGAGDEDTGKRYANKFSVLGCVVGVFLAGLIALSAKPVLTLFNVSETVLHDSLMILYITALIMIVRVFNIILIVGILRGGGDARYSLKLEAFTMWGIGVPLSFIGAFWIKLPIYGVVALVTAEEIVKCIFGIVRLKSNAWMRRVIHNM